MNAEFEYIEADESPEVQKLLAIYADAMIEPRRILDAIKALRLSALTDEPDCPECGSGILRPRCLNEHGGACPRHDLAESYGGAYRIRKHLGAKP